MVVGTKWGYWNVTHDLAKHSRHNYTWRGYDLTYNEALRYDVINCLNVDVWKILESHWGRQTALNLTKKRKVICGAVSEKTIARGFEVLQRVPFFFVRAASKKMGKYLEDKLNNPHVRVIPINFADPEKFYPLNLPKTGFTVGWAGNYNREEKRTAWLHDIKYPLRIATCNHNYLHLNDAASVNLLYNIVDAYVCVSRTEGAPLTLMEAMAAELPVVSTDVGLAPELLEPEWVVPQGTREQTAKRVNSRLDRLYRNPELRARTGKRNRRKILDEYSVEIASNQYDTLFEEEFIPQ